MNKLYITEAQFKLLVENKQLMMKIIKDFLDSDSEEHIQIGYKNYSKILEFIKEPNLKPIFLYFKLANNLNIQLLKELYENYKELKKYNLKLPRPLSDYLTKFKNSQIKSYEVFSDDIRNEFINLKFRKIIRKFPKNLHKYILDDTDGVIKNSIQKLLDLTDNNYEPKKYDKVTNYQEFIEKLEYDIELYDSESLISVKNKINSTNNVSLIYDKNNILIAQIGDKSASQELGCTKTWCISYLNGNLWNTYINSKKPNVQFFIWDYNVKNNDPNSKIGLTYNFINDMISSSHDMNDGSNIPYVKEKFVEKIDFLNIIDKKLLRNILYNNPYVEYFVEPTDENLQLMQVFQDPGVIKGLVDPSGKVQLMAIEKDALMIQYIEKPTKKVQEVAISKNIGIFNLLKNKLNKLDDDITEHAIKTHPTLIGTVSERDLTESLIKLAIDHSEGHQINAVIDKVVDKPEFNEELLKYAMDTHNNYNLIFYYKEPSYSLKKYVLEKSVNVGLQTIDKLEPDLEEEYVDEVNASIVRNPSINVIRKYLLDDTEYLYDIYEKNSEKFDKIYNLLDDNEKISIKKSFITETEYIHDSDYSNLVWSFFSKYKFYPKKYKAYDLDFYKENDKFYVNFKGFDEFDYNYLMDEEYVNTYESAFDLNFYQHYTEPYEIEQLDYVDEEEGNKIINFINKKEQGNYPTFDTTKYDNFRIYVSDEKLYLNEIFNDVIRENISNAYSRTNVILSNDKVVSNIQDFIMEELFGYSDNEKLNYDEENKYYKQEISEERYILHFLKDNGKFYYELKNNEPDTNADYVTMDKDMFNQELENELEYSLTESKKYILTKKQKNILIEGRHFLTSDDYEKELTEKEYKEMLYKFIKLRPKIYYSVDDADDLYVSYRYLKKADQSKLTEYLNEMGFGYSFYLNKIRLGEEIIKKMLPIK